MVLGLFQETNCMPDPKSKTAFLKHNFLRLSQLRPVDNTDCDKVMTYKSDSFWLYLKKKKKKKAQCG